MARMTRSRRRRRKRYAWTGIAGSTLMEDSGGAVILGIVEPTSFPTVADVLLERVVLDMSIHHQQGSESSSFSGAIFGVYIHVVETDGGESPVVEALWNPITTDIDHLQKRPLWWRHFVIPGGSGTDDTGDNRWSVGTGGAAVIRVTTNSPYAFPTEGWNGGQPIDFNVKRKLGGDLALVLVGAVQSLEGTFNGSDLKFQFQARALVSVGRK